MFRTNKQGLRSRLAVASRASHASSRSCCGLCRISRGLRSFAASAVTPFKTFYTPCCVNDFHRSREKRMTSTRYSYFSEWVFVAVRPDDSVISVDGGSR